jgi:hypothetical protein
MNDDERKTSDYLKAFVPRPAPPELRPKVLAAAGRPLPSVRYLTPNQWGVAAACVLLIIGALAGDAFLSRTQARQLDALLSDRQAASSDRDAERSALEEIIGVQATRSMRFPSTRTLPERTSHQDGRTDRNILAFEEKEDVDVHSKNPR